MLQSPRCLKAMNTDPRGKVKVYNDDVSIWTRTSRLERLTKQPSFIASHVRCLVPKLKITNYKFSDLKKTRLEIGLKREGIWYKMFEKKQHLYHGRSTIYRQTDGKMMGKITWAFTYKVYLSVNDAQTIHFVLINLFMTRNPSPYVV